MKLKKILCVISAMALSAAMLIGCDKESSSTAGDTTDIAKEEVTEQPAEPEAPKVAGGNIRFMSAYDLNPVPGADRSIALTLFEDVYGGKIEWVPTTEENMYDDLSRSVLGGDPVDMFPYTDNALPYGVAEGYFDPVDQYIDFESDLWKDTKTLADKMAYKGEHYAVPTGINEVYGLIYSRKAVKDMDFDDPYKLYNDGKWTWETFIDMMKEYENSGCAGFIGKGIMQSTGQPYVNYDGSTFTSNLDNEALKEAGEMQDEIAGPMYDGGWYDTLSEDILFMGMGSWAVPQSNDANEDEDVFFVPYPSKDGSGKYITADINSKMLVKGSKNAGAVAAYLECERIAATEEKYVKAQKDAALKKGFTEEQYDFISSLKNDMDNVVFDFTYGFDKKVSHDASSYKERGAVNNLNDAIIIGFEDVPDSWSKLCGKMKDKIEKQLGTY